MSRLAKNAKSFLLGNLQTKLYWTGHNVTSHHSFTGPEDSLSYFHWRNDQYFKYIDLMPVSGQDAKAVLDYGCGPGHDLIGFGVFSKPTRLVGADISSSSLAEASARLALHKIKAETVQILPELSSLPFEDESFDFIHSSGVLHHTPEPLATLKELRRILRKDGTMNIMVYNYDSIWMHLYVAYQRGIIQGLHSKDSLREQFTHSTDGEHCPIANCYKPSEWIALCKEGGLHAEFTGAAFSMHEASLLHLRFAAIQNRCLPEESRKFLLCLKFDEYGYPLYNGHYAGVDACFQIRKQS